MSLNRMQGSETGEESPQGERQTTVVPVARKDSNADVTILPGIDPMSFLEIHLDCFSISCSERTDVESGGDGISLKKVTSKKARS